MSRIEWRPSSRVLVVSAALAMAGLACPPARADASAQEPLSQVERTFRDLHYRSVGPSRGGRVTAVAGHATQPYTFYMGATGGGVWKTVDYGTTWRPISDGYFETGSIGSIRVAPSNPNIIYVGTGSDGIRSNVITGRGIYRSDDAGETWRRLGLVEMGQLGAVEVHPTNPDIAYVAALGNAWAKSPDRGVYRTRDGGRTWDQVLFTSDSVGAIDLEINTANPNEIYAGMWRGQRQPWTIISGMEASAEEDGIWKSTDGGDTWRIVRTGLPTGLIGKVDLSVTADMPNRVYALVETTDPNEGLYRSDDFGESWQLMSNQDGLMNRPFYYTGVTADPTDGDHVYVNNEGYFESTDGGRTFERRQTPHGDNHDTWINSVNPLIQIQSNDGGANVTLDGGETWSSQYNQPTAELYQVDIDTQFPYWLYAGQQDNSTIRVPSNAPANASVGGHQGNWQEVGGCETGPSVPKPGDPDVVYSSCKGRFGRYSAATGQEKQYYVGFENLYGVNPAELEYRFQRTVPVEVSPHDPTVVYHGSQYVHKTTDDGVVWEQISPDLTAFPPERQMVSGGPITRDITGEEHYSVLYSIEESPVTPGVIWAGSNDGPVHVTRDGGRTWTNVTPPMPSEGRVQTIDPSPHDAGRAYVAAYRTLLGDFTPYIYRTDDYGASWTLLTTGSNGIPSHHPTRAVREDTEREGLLFAGTEFGMYVSFDDGGRWQELQYNLPRTPITDIKVHDNDLVLSTMGRGFWIMDNISPLRAGVESATTGGFTFLQPLDAYRLRGGGFGGFGGGGPDEPQYSRPGAELDYMLGAVAQRVSVEILDAAGSVVRTYESGGSGARTEPAQEMRGPFLRQTGGATPTTHAGLNRFVWDLTVPGPNGRGRGPMVVPGTYTARLTVDGQSQTRSFGVLMDPRVVADGVTVADVQEQFDLGIEIRTAIEDADATIGRLEQAMERVAEGSEIEGQLKEIERALLTDETISSYPQPMLRDQFQYLYGNSISADQEPGEDMYERLEVLVAELEQHKERLARLSRLVSDR